MQRNHKKAHWDVAIIGAGPAGAACAITLAQRGWRVLILDKQNTLRRKPGESLPPLAASLLGSLIGALNTDTLSVWGLAKTRGNISCWSSTEPDLADFFFTPQGYGLGIDRQCFDQQLLVKAQQEGAHLLRGTRLMECERRSANTTNSEDAEHWCVTLQGRLMQTQHTARYLVDASGRRSVLAKKLGVMRQSHDQLFAFCQRYTTTSADDDAFTRLEACPQGWWYSHVTPKTPGSDTWERSLVFHTDRDLLSPQQAATAEGFAALLAQCSYLPAQLSQLGYSASGKITGANAASERLSAFAGPGWLAVGDAAQAYDPLSSQGIGKALESGCEAGQRLHYALSESCNRQGAEHAQLTHYATAQEQQWRLYQKQHRFYYEGQKRWPDHDFWHRRRSHSTSSAQNTNSSRTAT